MKKLSDYSIRRFELENLFRNRLSPVQVDNISDIVKTLGKYMILDRSMLQFRLGRKIGLSYLVHTVDYGLVTEYKFKHENEEKNLFFFSLNTAGIILLKLDGFNFNILPLTCGYDAKSRILTFNLWAIENGFDLIRGGVNSSKFDFFIVKNKFGKKAIAYFENIVTEEEILQILLDRYNKECEEDNEKEDDNIVLEKLNKMYMFKAIDTKIINIGSNTIANDYSALGKNKNNNEID